MPNIDRRKLLHAGIALAVPLGSISLFGGCQQSTENANDEEATQSNETDNTVVESSDQKDEGEMMKIQYLEIVTPEFEALCKQYSAIHGITFGEPEPNLGNARVAKLEGGGSLAIRGPLREDETPVIRPYMLVENLEESVAAATEAGAEIAIPKMEIPGHGTIAVVIQGGIECGLWQN